MPKKSTLKEILVSNIPDEDQLLGLLYEELHNSIQMIEDISDQNRSEDDRPSINIDIKKMVNK